MEWSLPQHPLCKVVLLFSEMLNKNKHYISVASSTIYKMEYWLQCVKETWIHFVYKSQNTFKQPFKAVFAIKNVNNIFLSHFRKQISKL